MFWTALKKARRFASAPRALSLPSRAAAASHAGGPAGRGCVPRRVRIDRPRRGDSTGRQVGQGSCPRHGHGRQERAADVRAATTGCRVWPLFGRPAQLSRVHSFRQAISQSCTTSAPLAKVQDEATIGAPCASCFRALPAPRCLHARPRRPRPSGRPSARPSRPHSRSPVFVPSPRLRHSPTFVFT
jgi:hypothetical protein